MQLFSCQYCSVPIVSYKPRTFCSKACQWAAGRKRYRFICLECGTIFYVNVAQRRYCSRACKGRAQSRLNQGANNPNWKPTKDLHYTVRHALRKRILARDKVCQECGSSHQLQVHHRDGNHKNNDESNLTLLCVQHHAAAHAARGEFAIARLILSHRLYHQRPDNICQNCQQPFRARTKQIRSCSPECAQKLRNQGRSAAFARKRDAKQQLSSQLDLPFL